MTTTDDLASRHGISFGDAFRVWARIALLSFGGPAGQIALMHRILVDERRWISDRRFLHALNYCMLLPGPEAQQLAVYIGWLMNGIRGGLVSGLLFILPGFIALMILSVMYALYGTVPMVQALFLGLKAAVLAVVLEAVIRIGKRALKSGTAVVIAFAAFAAMFLFNAPFPLVIIAAAMAGALMLGMQTHTAEGDASAPDDSVVGRLFADGIPLHARPNTRRAATIAAIMLTLWLGPVAALVGLYGGDNVFAKIGTFFSHMAVVTFGGAYAVLAYVAQAAVETLGWLAPGEMLDGLGMAETTPGPLIMVLQFVGFMAAFRNPGTLDPVLAGTLGGILTVWVTFVPSFLWIFLGAPYVESLRTNRWLNAALSGVTAAVVGVILNLALWFGLHTLFTETEQTMGHSVEVPVLASLQPAAAALSLLAVIALFVVRIGMIWTFVLCAAAGIALHLSG